MFILLWIIGMIVVYVWMHKREKEWLKTKVYSLSDFGFPPQEFHPKIIIFGSLITIFSFCIFKITGLVIRLIDKIFKIQK